MANRYLTSTSVFKPFSFQEMLQPYSIYTDAYNKIEEELSNLDLMAADVASKLNNPKDKTLQQEAVNFQAELTSAMNELYEKGLNPKTRKKLAALKSAYTNKLNPINEAYKAYQEDQKYLMRFNREHPEFIIEGLGNSITDYMNGNIPSGLTANTKSIFDNSMKEAAGTSSRFSKLFKPTEILGDMYYQFKSTQGISQDAVRALNTHFKNPNNLKTAEEKALYNIIQRQRESNNYDSFSQEGKDRIDASILNGIFAGVSYKEDVDRVANKGWVDPNSPNDGTDTPLTDPSQLFYREVPRVEVDGKTNTTIIKEDIDFLSKVAANPSILNDIWKKPTTYVGYNQKVQTEEKTYLDRLQELSKEYGVDFNIQDNNGNINISGIEEATAKLANKILESATSRQDYILSMTDYNLADKIIMQNLDTFAANTGRRDYSGLKTLEGSEIKNKNKTDYLDGEKSIMFSPSQGVVLMTTKDGKTKYSIIDPFALDGTGILYNYISTIKKAIEKKDYTTANNWIKGSDGKSGIMEYLYNMFNTIPYVQGKTDSKIK